MASPVYSPVSVCNMALTRLDVEQITDLSEDSKQARLCNANYDLLRDSFLRGHPWNFAIRRQTLASSDPAPNHEYAYRYPLPDDFLAMVRTDYEAQDICTDYRIEAGSIVTSDADAKIEYVARVEDLNLWDPLAIDAFAQRLAAELSHALSGSASVTQAQWQIYEVKLSAAKTVDSQHGTPRIATPNEWLYARVFGVS